MTSPLCSLHIHYQKCSPHFGTSVAHPASGTTGWQGSFQIADAACILHSGEINARLQALHEAERYHEQLDRDFRSRQGELNDQSRQANDIEKDMQNLRRAQGETPRQYVFGASVLRGRESAGLPLMNGHVREGSKDRPAL